MKRIQVLIILLIIFALQDSQAQLKKVERAYESFQAGEYYKAIDHFKVVYSKTSKKDKENRAELVFMIGECYRLINDPKNAETWYKQAIRSSNTKPEAQFWLAESLKKSGKYQNAIDEFKKYKQIAQTDARADQEIRACELALEWQRDPELYKVEEIRDLNSRESDFSPAYGRDDFGVVLFTSSRDDALGNKTHGATGQGFTDIFESRLDKKSKWSIPVPVDVINSEAEEGTPLLQVISRALFYPVRQVSVNRKDA